MGAVRIRLHGIDAPEMNTANGRAAREHLRSLIGGGEIRCSDTGSRSYDRVVAACFGPDGRDLALAMVEDGWAVDLPRFSGGRYQAAQQFAETRRLGIHHGQIPKVR